MLVLAAILAAFAATQVAPEATRQARVTVVDPSPATIAGTGFQSREHVRVTVSLDLEARAKTVTATAAGRFRVTFAVSLGPCEIYTVTARGDRGSRATLRVVPACAAP